MKKLIVFYSLDGNTRFIAQEIAKNIEGDILELKTVKAIPEKGIMKYFWGGKQIVMKEQPEFQPYNRNFNDYELIFLGTPVWAGTFVPAIKTFLSENDLSNKKIFLFASCGGSIDKTFINLKKELNGAKIIGELGLLNPLKNQAKAVTEIKNIRLD